MIPPAQPPIPLVMRRIMTQPSCEPRSCPIPYTCSGLSQSGPTFPCDTRAHMKMAKAAMVTTTDANIAGMRYLAQTLNGQSTRKCHKIRTVLVLGEIWAEIRPKI